MFSDELAGNASRRRQEQSKARRRKLKEQKLKSENSSKEKESSPKHTEEIDKHVPSSDGKAEEGGHGANSSVETLTRQGSSSGAHSSKASVSAVEKALEQRKVRSFQKLHNTSATIIQASFRAFQSNRLLVKGQRDLLEKRIGDLVTLSQLLRKQEKDYVPPPSLVNLMVNQMLFVLHSTARHRKIIMSDNHDKEEGITVGYFAAIANDLTKKDGNMFAKLIQYAILPGLLSSDDHLDPSLNWLESKVGQVKFRKILRMCCHLIIARERVVSGKKGKNVSTAAPFVATEDDLSIIYNMFQTILGINKMTSARSNVIEFCRNSLLSMLSDRHVSRPLMIGQKPCKVESLDLLRILRSFLLFPSGEDVNVIPANANQVRRRCISDADRMRATGLFSLLSEVAIVTTNDLYFLSRFVFEIFTVPLLTWRIGQNAIDAMIGIGKDQNTHTMPPFLCALSAFVKIYQEKMSNNLISVLPHLPLKRCSAPPELSLCANLICFATSCSMINGSNREIFHSEAATLFFDFMTLLLDVVPIGALSSRESEVGWIEEGSHLQPLILSTVVREQCKLVLIDSFTRELFNIAIDLSTVDTDVILQQKDSKDKKLEKELDEIKSQSVVSVAASEAMADKNNGVFWKKSKWAKNLANKMNSILSGGKKGIDAREKGQGALMNTSALSRELAHGKKTSQNKAINLKDQSFSLSKKYVKKRGSDLEFLLALTRTYAIILSRWGGIGHHVIMGYNFNADQLKNQKFTHAVEKRDPSIMSFLNVLSFSTTFVRTSWALIQSNPDIKTYLEYLEGTKKKGSSVISSHLSPTVKNGYLHYGEHKGSALFILFNSALAHTLIITDDVELHEMESPLPIHQIRRVIAVLKNLLYRACCLDMQSNDAGSSHIGLSLISSSAKVQRDLYDRSSRRLLCSPKIWLIDDLLENEIRRGKNHDDYIAIMHRPVLQICPFLISFKRRLKLFERIIVTDRERIQGRNDGQSFRPGIQVHIMRNRVLEDGLIHLNKLGRDLRKRLIVHYVNEAGVSETGLDAGGLFKEFWTDLSNQSLNPNWALFQETEDGFLFPNPSSRAAHGSDSIMLFEFLGRILGKAIYESITIQPQFAHFFLSFVRGDYNFLHMLADLSTMDRTLYNNLMFLKTYDGNAEDLCLSFAITKSEFGCNEEMALIPGGKNKDVTDLNKHHYIELVAKHYVCDQVKEQSEAFRRGLWDVIDRQWLRIFNEPELQVVISGATDGSVDVEDIKANTKYVGGYTIFDRNVHNFWKVVSSFNERQRADLLKFVTSCERPPPLGFASMNPPFTIQRVQINKDEEKLPTASTCFNILKLPTYSSAKVMKAKLLYSIESRSGFELT